MGVTMRLDELHWCRLHSSLVKYAAFRTPTDPTCSIYMYSGGTYSIYAHETWRDIDVVTAQAVMFYLEARHP